MKSKIKRNIIIIICIIIAAACAGLYIYIYTIPNISGSLADTSVLQWGELKTQDNETALIVRSENVYSAGKEGILSYYIEDSQKTRRYVKVADIYPAKGSPEAYTCSETGFVSYYIDGYEDVLTPDTITEIKPEDFLNLEEYIVPSDVRTGTAVEGQTLYKLVNSDVWYIVALVPEENIWSYEWNKNVTVVLNGKELRCTITNLTDTGDYWLAVMSTKQYYEDFARIRMVDVTIVTEDSEGLIVPLSSIVYEDGNPGVYVKNINGGYDFTRIKIVSESDTECLVASDSFTEKNENGDTKTIGTVSIYDEILRKPRQAGGDEDNVPDSQ